MGHEIIPCNVAATITRMYFIQEHNRESFGDRRVILQVRWVWKREKDSISVERTFYSQLLEGSHYSIWL